MKKTIIYIILLIAILGWFYSERYMYIGSEEGRNYVMNKWTGKIYRIGTNNAGQIGEGGLSHF